MVKSNKKKKRVGRFDKVLLSYVNLPPIDKYLVFHPTNFLLVNFLILVALVVEACMIYG